MYNRYENTSSDNSSMSSSLHGVFLGTAREKRDKLLKKAYLNQHLTGAPSGWQPHTASPQSAHESYPSEFRYVRHQPSSRTHSVDSISSSTTNTAAVALTSEHQMSRTASQTSLNIHRASPCPSDMSFSYSNPKYFVHTALLRPASALPAKRSLHYNNIVVSY